MAQANDLAQGAGFSGPIGEKEQFRARPAPSTTPHHEKAPFPEGSFTPGPWTLKRSPGLYDGAHDYAISAAGATVLSETFGRGALGEWLPAEANARLIAAAPDLHSALEDLFIHVGMGWEIDDCLKAAEAALSKATGGQHV